MVKPDEERMIVVVTGANSGFGLGICQQILSNLSLPPGTPLPAATPSELALAPAQRHLLSQSPRRPLAYGTLTLILACRSGARAEEARKILLDKHHKELAKRKEKGIVREGWLEGLQVVWEGVDLDSPGGPDGMLKFCDRLKATYPHINYLFLNAGLGVWTGNNYWRIMTQCFTEGAFSAFSQQSSSYERSGVKSADGERGLVWGVNTLAPYILSRELAPLLQQSPKSLPPPRIVYTSSRTASLDDLCSEPLKDPQLLTYGQDLSTSVYSSSKYFGDLIMVQLDRELEGIRCLTADPGVIWSGLYNGFGNFKPWVWFISRAFWLALYLLRLFGSPFHPVNGSGGAVVMVYAALVDETYLQPADQVPAQKFAVQANRWDTAKVLYGEVDKWEETDDLGHGMLEVCEGVRQDWKRREGL